MGLGKAPLLQMCQPGEVARSDARPPGMHRQQ